MIGTFWYTSPGPFDAPGASVYCVVAPNINTEAGPDSWEMRRIDGKHTKYMHHKARLRGEWIPV